MDRFSLGSLCIERGILTEKQLANCLELQQKAERWRSLGEILMSEGVLSGVSLANMLSIQGALRRTLPHTRGQGSAAPPPSELGWLLREYQAQGATDLILGAGQPPAIRAQGRTELLEGPPMQLTQVQKMLAEALPPELVQRLETQSHVSDVLDFRGQGRVRVDLYRHAGGLAARMHLIPSQATPLAALPVPSGVRKLASLRNGLVLVTGPKGSGVWETVVSLLDAIHAQRACHTVLVERSLERVIANRKARITRREVGNDVPDFASGIRAALRSDADVIALSELRGPEAIACALDAVSCHRLVIAAMSTGGAQKTIARILDSLPEERVGAARGELATGLCAILSLRLFPARDGGEPSRAVEYMRMTPGIGNLIRENKIDGIANILQTNRSEEMISLEESIARLLRKGKVSLADALEAANDPERLRRLAQTTREAREKREARRAGN